MLLCVTHQSLFLTCLAPAPPHNPLCLNNPFVAVLAEETGGGGVAISGGTAGVKRKRAEPRDPNAPKRPCSAYIYFSNEMRPKLREERPDMSMADRSKHIGKEWATLQLDKEEGEWEGRREGDGVAIERAVKKASN